MSLTRIKQASLFALLQIAPLTLPPGTLRALLLLFLLQQSLLLLLLLLLNRHLVQESLCLHRLPELFAFLLLLLALFLLGSLFVRERVLNASLFLFGTFGLRTHYGGHGGFDVGVAEGLGERLEGAQRDVTNILELYIFHNLLQLGDEQRTERRNRIGRVDQPRHVLDNDTAGSFADGILFFETAAENGTQNGEGRGINSGDECGGHELLHGLVRVSRLGDGVNNGGDGRASHPDC
mmetsp:Transcript_11659/g.25170  ORF Transcript_11659/g.25170 Transcript_11659/m.25170 type:complete len:236 (+) Transcript_11659:126-833(+)